MESDSRKTLVPLIRSECLHRLDRSRVEYEITVRYLDRYIADDAVVVALRALDTASEADTATGGIDRHAKIFPIMKMVSASGISTLPEEKIAELFRKRVA